MFGIKRALLPASPAQLPGNPVWEQHFAKEDPRIEVEGGECQHRSQPFLTVDPDSTCGYGLIICLDAFDLPVFPEGSRYVCFHVFGGQLGCSTRGAVVVVDSVSGACPS